MSVRIPITADESPWSNSLVERHNATLSVTAEYKYNLETTPACVIQANNSLANIDAFTPVQLAIGYTSQISNVLDIKPLPLEQRTSQDTVTENPNWLKAVREAFIRIGSSERI